MIEDKAALTYLQQIQAHDLATAMPRIYHDLQMVFNSYVSYFELLEAQLKTVHLADDIAELCRTNLQDTIRKFRSIVDLCFRELPVDSPKAIGFWRAALSHDIRAPISNFIGWADVLQYEIDANHVLPSQTKQQTQRLNQAMQSTLKRLYVIIEASFLISSSENR